MLLSKTGLGWDSFCSSLSQPDSQVGCVHFPAASSLPAAYLVMEYNPGLFPPVSSNRFPRRSPVVAQSSRTRSERFSFIYLLTGCSGSWLLHAGFLRWWWAGATLRCGAPALGFRSCSMQAQQLWHMGLVTPRRVASSWTRDWTHSSLNWQTDSQPLGHQGSPIWTC